MRCVFLLIAALLAMPAFASGECKRNFTDQERRTATVRNQVLEGMTRDEAIRAWGKPTSINGSQYAYHWRNNVSGYFYVRNGCVTSVSGEYGGRR